MKHSSHRVLIAPIAATLVAITAFASQVFAASTPLSPVVQVRTYGAIHGKYPEAIWQGSASIISKDGLLLTNNHVVEDQNESDAAGYVICMTMEQGKAPECNYTARLIARDKKMDVALLQLDSKDIAGQTINFSSLPVLDIDYSYTPKEKDGVNAIGYPGIGGETMTTTNGTVAGTNSYNSFTYIKTDATIAPGNSGGPMVSAAGKLIGVNTFGNFDIGEGLGYALLISEAQDFIQKNKGGKPAASLYNLDLVSYAHTIDQINKTKKLTLPWITYTVPAHYEIRNVLSDSSFAQKPKDQRDIQAEYMNISTIATPTLDTEKQLFYYLEKNNFYSKEYSKLIPITIGGKKFYQLVSKYDETNGVGGEGQYVGQINNHVVAAITVYIGGETESKLEEVKAEKKLILDSIAFTDAATYRPAADGIIIDPAVQFNHPVLWAGELIAGLGFGSYDRLTNATLFQGNLHDEIKVAISKSTKSTDIKKLYATELKDVAQEKKVKGMLQGKEAYMTCDENNNVSVRRGYSPILGGDGRSSVAVDESNKPLQQYGCAITTMAVGPSGIPYRVDIAIHGPRATKEASLTAMLKAIDKEIHVGDGKTTLTNIFLNKPAFEYKDIGDQSAEFKKMIKTLVKYKLLQPAEKFNANMPVTYGLLLEKYLSWVHNIDVKNTSCSTFECMLHAKSVEVQGAEVPLDTLLSPLAIDRRAYVNKATVTQFLFYVHLRLAGVSLPTYSESALELLTTDKNNTEYTDIYQKIDAYDAQLYGARKIGFAETQGDGYYGYNSVENAFNATFGGTLFTPRVALKYLPTQGIQEITILNTKPLRFNESTTKLPRITNYSTCLAVLSPMTCAGEYLKGFGVFSVLSKGEMVDGLVPMMDFGFFDKELADKKETQIGGDDLDAMQSQ